MKRFKKILIAAAVGVVLVVVLALVWIDAIVKAGIEGAGTRALGVPTTLKQIKIGIFRTNCSLSGFQVANPPGFKSKYFLRLDEGAIDLSARSLLSNLVEIPTLTLTGIHLNLVRETDRANFRTIIDNIKRLDAQRDQPAEKRAADDKNRKKFIIRHLVIKKIDVNVDLLPIGGELTKLTVPIEELTLDNVGTGSNNQGETLARVTGTVVMAVLNAVLAKGESLLPPEVVDELRERLADFHPLERLREFRQRREQGDRVLPRLRDRSPDDEPREPLLPRLRDRSTDDEPREPLLPGLRSDRPLSERPGPLRSRLQDRRARRNGSGEPAPEP